VLAQPVLSLAQLVDLLAQFGDAAVLLLKLGFEFADAPLVVVCVVCHVTALWLQIIAISTQRNRSRRRRRGARCSAARSSPKPPRRARPRNREKADKFASNTRPAIEQIRRSGITTFRGIAAARNARGIPTARGGTWTPVQIMAIERRV
jgi:hypothetical protein